MFSLIVTVISVILVAALAIATIYYGGPAFSKGTVKAKAASVLSGAQQIAGANTLYALNNGSNFAPDIGTLTAGSIYLQRYPLPPKYVSDTPFAVAGVSQNKTTLAVTNDAVCTEIHRLSEVSGTQTPAPAPEPAAPAIPAGAAVGDVAGAFPSIQFNSYSYLFMATGLVWDGAAQTYKDPPITRQPNGSWTSPANFRTYSFSRVLTYDVSANMDAAISYIATGTNKAGEGFFATRNSAGGLTIANVNGEPLFMKITFSTTAAQYNPASTGLGGLGLTSAWKMVSTPAVPAVTPPTGNGSQTGSGRFDCVAGAFYFNG